MNGRASRRRVLGIAGGIAGLGLVGGLSGARDGPTAAQDDGEDDYWTVTAGTAAETVTSDTGDDVTSDGDVYVTAGVEIDGNVEAGRDALVGPDGEVDGDVTAAGTVVLDAGADVDGTVAGELIVFHADASVGDDDGDDDSDDDDDGDDDDGNGDGGDDGDDGDGGDDDSDDDDNDD